MFCCCCQIIAKFMVCVLRGASVAIIKRKTMYPSQVRAESMDISRLVLLLCFVCPYLGTSMLAVYFYQSSLQFECVNVLPGNTL